MSSDGISTVHQLVRTLVRGQEGSYRTPNSDFVLYSLEHEYLTEIQDRETQSILSWLSPKYFWLQQADLSNRRQPGTGEALLQHPEFLEWTEGKKDTIWCRGGREFWFYRSGSSLCVN